MERRLDWKPRFDERSRNFPIRAVTPSVPRSYTWAPGPAVLDQGNEGACVGFGFAHELMARPARVPNVSYATAIDLYQQAKQVDEWEGVDYDGTSVLAGAKVTKKLGYYGEYRWGFNAHDARLALGYKGPIVFGCWWHADMWDTDAKGFIWPTGGKVGGHCVYLFANSEREKYVWGGNSWGLGWGVGGRFKLSHEALHYLIEDEAETCIPMLRKVLP